jgi:predicted lipoprotein with Yx(FWY)xxD motif
MRHPKIIIASLSLAAVAAAGGITATAVGGSSAASASSAQAAAHSGRATVHTAPATVAGKTETILVNGRGLPLYYYRPDTATRSLVTGGLAQLWPPLTSAAPAATGVGGKLAVLSDGNGRQVTYNGHPLYTFADDAAGQVTGQGVQDFFVVTPGLAPLTTSAAPAAPAPQSGVGY